MYLLLHTNASMNFALFPKPFVLVYQSDRGYVPVSDELEDLDEELAQSFSPHSALQLHLVTESKRQTISVFIIYFLLCSQFDREVG